MDHLIEDLKSISGVLGGFIYNSHKGVIASNLPAIFKLVNLSEIGNMVAKIYGTGSMNFTDITEVSLYYEESVLLVKEVSPDLYLIVVGDPSSNINLLTISMNLIAENLKKISDVDNIPIQTLDEDADAGKRYTVEEVMESGPLAGSLNGMRTALAKIMGPMARIIFDDAVDEWLASNDPSWESLASLTGILNREISAPEKIIQYKALIAPYIEANNQ